jgi:transcriptional regulator with XRE-family HTH domain
MVFGLYIDKILENFVYHLARLKEERKRSRLTQEELALLSGVSRDAIARLETTNRRATPETARKLARVLKVRPQDLF